MTKPDLDHLDHLDRFVELTADLLKGFPAPIELWTDGSCLSHLDKDRSPGGWAFLVVFPNNLITHKSGPLQSVDSNEAELQAIIRGLEFIKRQNIGSRYPICVYTDCAVVLDFVEDQSKKPTSLKEFTRKIRCHCFYEQLLKIARLSSFRVTSWVRVDKKHAWHKKVHQLAYNAASGANARTYKSCLHNLYFNWSRIVMLPPLECKQLYLNQAPDNIEEEIMSTVQVPELWMIPELSDLFDIKQQTIRNWRDRGNIPAGTVRNRKIQFNEREFVKIAKCVHDRAAMLYLKEDFQIMSSIKGNLARLREAAGLTQTQFARKLGSLVNVDLVKYWENGYIKPSFKFQQHICEVLGITLAQLIEEKSPVVTELAQAQEMVPENVHVSETLITQERANDVLSSKIPAVTANEAVFTVFQKVSQKRETLLQRKNVLQEELELLEVELLEIDEDHQQITGALTLFQKYA